jgi:hypothetical protein
MKHTTLKEFEKSKSIADKMRDRKLITPEWARSPHLGNKSPGYWRDR